jgi:hypothetical protein
MSLTDPDKSLKLKIKKENDLENSKFAPEIQAKLSQIEKARLQVLQLFFQKYLYRGVTGEEAITKA